MHHFKGLNRFLAGLVACGVCVGLLAGSASALGFTSAAIPNVTAPSVTVDTENAPQAADRLVSTIHYSASYSSTVIGCLEDGTEVTVLGTSGSFYKIDCFEMKGYISKTQVTQEADGKYYVTSDPTSSEAKYLPAVTQEQVLTLRETVRAEALSMQGVRYVSGGYSRRGIDCSGLTRWVYSAAGYSIRYTATPQMSDGVIVSQDNLQCGDLIFFKNTTNAGTLATHVGIYLGNGKLIHAGDHGVSVVELSNRYFQNHYLCARRIILSSPALRAMLPNLATSQDINSSYWRSSSQAQ